MGYLSRKEEIVLSTISLIHEMGVSNVSMKEIAKREGVTEASIYKHFKSKEELLSMVISYYEHYDNFIYNTMKESRDRAVDNILKFFNIYAIYYNNYREISALIDTYGVLAYEKAFSERAVKRMKENTIFIEELIQKAQQEKELLKEIHPESLSYILLGSFDRIISMWRLTEYSFSLIQKTEEVIGDIILAYQLRDGSRCRQSAATEEKKVKK